MSPEASRTVPDVVNVAAYLPLMAANQPDFVVVAVATGCNPDGSGRYDTMTASKLNQRSDRIAHGLASVGIKEGVRAVLMVKPSPEFFAIVFAMLKVGAVPVLVDPGMGIKNLGQCLEEAQPEAFIGIPAAHVARVVLSWAKRTNRLNVTVGCRLFWGGHVLSKIEKTASSSPYQALDPPSDQTAAIIFTSGSTGVPKGVVTPFGVFAEQVKAIRQSFGIEPGERDLATFPLFALFGPALGIASIVPEMNASRPASADPEKLLRAFNDFECTNLFASPALIEKLGRYCDARGTKLTSLRRAISAGAPASIPALERFQRIVPEGAEIFTPYGATECLPVAVFGSREILRTTRKQTESGAGVCVGYPVPGVDVAIIAITDDPIADWSDDFALPANEIGEIVVKGPIVTQSYFNREESTRAAKIHDSDGNNRHRMGDIGYLDDDGKLWMCGRKSHRVVVGETTMFTVPCEAVFNTHCKVFRTAIVGVSRGDGVEPVLCVELERDAKVNTRVLQKELREIAQSHEHTEGIKTFLIHPSFPVDTRHNAKIFREKLAQWARKKLV